MQCRKGADVRISLCTIVILILCCASFVKANGAAYAVGLSWRGALGNNDTSWSQVLVPFRVPLEYISIVVEDSPLKFFK
jgi:hypothetical protein